MYIKMQAKEQITLYSTVVLYTSITILEFIKHCIIYVRILRVQGPLTVHVMYVYSKMHIM